MSITKSYHDLCKEIDGKEYTKKALTTPRISNKIKYKGVVR